MSFSTARMPIVFIGHGNPMNAVETNAFTQSLSELGKKLPQPKAVLCISAHWMTEGTWVTAMSKPKTIHDFYGFPQELFDIQYPAPGHPELAKTICDTVASPSIHGDKEMWGLDHGAWSVLKHMYPQAAVPVVQLSLYMARGPEYHENIGQQLAKLREQGVLILGSGNLVHNLRRIRWEAQAPAYDWALEFDEWCRQKLMAKDYRSLLYDFHNSEAGKLSVPSMDHYWPLHYILGAAHKDDVLNFEYEEIQNASISMRSFTLG